MTADSTIRERPEELYFVCLFYARLPSNDSRYAQYGGHFRLLSDRYGVKYKTLTNIKDMYDAVFDDNGRRGWWQRPLEKQSKAAYEVYLQYKDMPIEEVEERVKQIIISAEAGTHTFYSIRTKDPESVKAILAKESSIEIDGLNVLKDGLTLETLVFIVLGGDKGSKDVTWETGLIGIGSVSREPYDEGYHGKNFKIQIDVKLLLEKPIKRENLVPYADTYDIIGIGPITKWEPNQAISQIAETKAVALLRAMLEFYPEIEKDLFNTFDQRLISRIMGTVRKYVAVHCEYGEQVPNTDLTADSTASSEEWAQSFEPDADTILDGFLMEREPISCIQNFVNLGKNLILTGPPGTGKTTLAERTCLEAVKLNYISGYSLTTAIADWSTFDTIGGYMPDKDGHLIFQEGIFLRSIRDNKWLIIDEINRAEIDKAFGHFFTVLSGSGVELQYCDEADKPISILHSESLNSFYDSLSATYYIGKNWRIIATMNTYDKNSLFTLSYAFMRRFAFVHIPAPNVRDFGILIGNHLAEDEASAKLLLELVKVSPKKLGAAVILDLISFLKYSDGKGVVNGICSLVIPQYEGINVKEIKDLYKRISVYLDESGREHLKNYLCEFFELDISILESITVSSGSNDVDSDISDE